MKFFFLITYCLTLRQIKGNCAESFTEYWTCLDYSNLAELRHCRKQQNVFDNCVLEKLGWERPELGDLSKVGQYIRCFVISLYSKWFRCLFGLLVHILYFSHRWPRWKPLGLCLKTPTIQDQDLSPILQFRLIYNHPSTAAACSSGTGKEQQSLSY